MPTDHTNPHPPIHSDTPGVLDTSSLPPRKQSSLPEILTLGIYALVLAAGITSVVIGLGAGGSEPSLAIRAIGYFAVIMVFTLFPVAWIILASRRAAAINHDRSIAAMREVSDAVRRLTEHAALSDDARRVLNRGAERELLRRAIQEDIHSGDFMAARVLCNELATRFGYKADADEMRRLIDEAQTETLDESIVDAVAEVEGFILQKRWDDARRAILRMSGSHPGSGHIARLTGRVDESRAAVKADLEARFLAAAHDDQPDEAMALLKELDPYLNEAETAPLRDLAHGVVSRARDALGKQFRAAVTERRWADAATLGRRITAEFPNTRMAGEVRGVLDGILQRANAPAS